MGYPSDISEEQWAIKEHFDTGNYGESTKVQSTQSRVQSPIILLTLYPQEQL